MEQLRFIPVIIHALLSYALGVALVVLPLTLQVDDGSVEAAVSIVAGVLVLALTLLGPSGAAASNVIPNRVMEGVSFVVSLGLVLYPVVFQLTDERVVLVTYAVVGLGYFAATLVTAWPRKGASTPPPSTPTREHP